ncbi:MAG: hypothetical protein ACREJD_04010 [Phycisphaerales bacterium]
MKLLASLFALTCTIAPHAFAQCGGQWLSGLQSPDLNATPSSAVEWDPDGAGPQEAVLVVAGSFTKASTLTLKGIVAWDGAKWFKLEGAQTFFGSALSAPKLLVSGGTLYALDGSTLHHWMGSGWMPHGEIHGITRIASFQGDLIAIGNLVFEPTVHKAARLHAGQWIAIDPPLSSSDQTYNDAIEYDGKLYYSGMFQFAGSPFTPWTSFITFDGTTWVDGGALPLASSTPAQNLCVASNKLYVMQGSQIYIREGAIWTALPLTTFGNAPMVEGTNGNLLFAVAQGSGLINEWDGAALKSAGNASVELNGPTPLDLVHSRFGVVAFGSYPNRISIYSGTSWSPIAESFGGMINAFGRLNGQLIAGQGFKGLTSSDFVSPYARIAKWDGLRFTTIGSAPHNPDLSNSPVAGIHTFVDEEENVLVGGSFRLFQDALAGGILQMSPSGEMHPLSSLLDLTDTSRGVAAFSFKRFQGRLHALGRFDSSSNGPLGNIARMGDSGWEWSDSGLTGVDTGGAYASIVWNDELVVGGSFSLAGQISVSNVARWNGTGWQPMGNPKGYIRAFAIFNGELYAAGTFDTSTYCLTKWNGNDWQPIAGAQGGVGNALVEYQSNLIVGGEPLSGAILLRKWNGATISEFSTVPRPGGKIYALAEDHNELVVGGDISLTVSGIQSNFFARWSPDGIPWIAQQPEPAAANCGRSLSFTAQPALGYTKYTKYQWRRNGTNLADGLAPSGATISGAKTLALKLTNVAPADSGNYDCVLTSSTTPTCPAVTTAPALATVLCCPADFTGDLLVDDADFQTFIVAYNTLECPPVCPADLNHDNVVDDLDFQLFLVAYNALVCE